MTLNSPEYMHLLIESKKLAYADLYKFVGDPTLACRADRWGPNPLSLLAVHQRVPGRRPHVWPGGRPTPFSSDVTVSTQRQRAELAAGFHRPITAAVAADYLERYATTL